MLMGRVDAIAWRPARVEALRLSAAVTEREECGDCWAKYICSGGCPAANLQATGSAVSAGSDLCGIYQIGAEAVLWGTVWKCAESVRFKDALC